MDVLLELILCLLEPVLDALVEYVLAALIDVFMRVLGAAFGFVMFDDPALAFTAYALFGVLFGLISLWLLPHHLVHPAKLRGLSLLIAPISVGYLMSATRELLAEIGN